MSGAKTIKDAVKGVKGGEYIIRAFKATRESDLFNGNLEDYLKVIAIRMEYQNAMLKSDEMLFDAVVKERKERHSEFYDEMKDAIHKEVYEKKG
jgi:hypothetical protein